MEKAKIIPIIKPWKEETDEESKFRPINLVDIGGKVLEKTLINRLNHHVYSRGHQNPVRIQTTKRALSTRQWKLKTSSKKAWHLEK